MSDGDGGRFAGTDGREPAAARIAGWTTFLALYFGPLAFGATERWAIAAFQALVFLSVALRLGAGPVPARTAPPGALIGALALLSLLALVQSLDVRAIDAPSSFLPFTVSLSAARAAVLQWLAYAGFAWLCARFVDGRRAAWTAAAAVFALGVLIAVLGIAQHGANNQWIYGIRLNLHYTSSFGPYVNRDHAATLLGAAFFTGAGLAGANIARRSSRADAPPLADVVAVGFLIAFGVGIILYGLMIAVSRGLRLAFVATLLAVVAAFALGGGTRAHRLWAAVAAGLVAYGLFLRGHPDMLGFTAAGPDLSLSLRAMTWRGALKMVADHPLFGTGLGAFASAFRYYQEFSLSLIIDHAHSDWLEILCQGGIVGAVLYAGGILSTACASALRWLRLRAPEERWLTVGFGAAALVIMLHSLADFPLQGAGNAGLFIALLAFGASATQVFSAPPERGARAPRPPSTPARRTLAAAALALAFVSAADAYVQGQVVRTDLLPPARFLAWTPSLGAVADDPAYRVHLARAQSVAVEAGAPDGPARLRRALTALEPLARREPSDPAVETLRDSLLARLRP